MGVIQNAINQTLGTAAIAARLLPEYETKQELYKLGKQEHVLSKQSDAAKLVGKEATDPDLIRNVGEIKEREMELSKKKFQLDPTEENFQAAVKKQQSYRSFNKYEELMMKQQEALDKANGISNAKKAQKRNFMSYLKEQPTSLGGTVGELPLSIQKQLAKQYSPAQRKQLMDTMDRESKKNGNNK